MKISKPKNYNLARSLFCILLCFMLVFSATSGMHTSSAGGYKTSFPDVNEKSWYYQNVMEMAERQIIRGYEDGRFHPSKTISNAEFISMVARCVGLKDSVGSADHWAADTMQAAFEAGWYDWDECPPTGDKFNSPIKRQIAVKVLIKAFAPNERGDYNVWSKAITDFSSLDGRYYDVVFAAYELGIVLGDDHGRFNPRNSLKRSEASALIYRTLKMFPQDDIKPLPDEPDEPVKPISGGVSENGWLSVNKTQLVNKDGKAVLLHGMSSHGMQWYSQFTSEGAIKTTRDYGANVFRVAMYTAENGYISNKDAIKKRVISAVDSAIKLDMYVIIDWHILSDNNPKTYQNEAVTFFSEISAKYKDKPNVIYEICNEPNGNVTWQNDIKPYAEKVIPAIRKNSPNSVIICGTSTWSQDVDAVAKSPLSYKNVMYALHFYAGTHTDWLRSRITAALKAGTPIFVSEWGTSSADGSGGVYLKEAETWLNFLDKNGISWVNWSLCDKSETSAALKPGASPAGGWKDKDLSDSGKFVFSRF